MKSVDPRVLWTVIHCSEDHDVVGQPGRPHALSPEATRDLSGEALIRFHPFLAKSANPVALWLLVDVSRSSLAGPGRREDDDWCLGGAEAHELVADPWLKMLRDLEAVSEVERSRGFDNALPPEIERPSVHSLASRQ